MWVSPLGIEPQGIVHHLALGFALLLSNSLQNFQALSVEVNSAFLHLGHPRHVHGAIVAARPFALRPDAARLGCCAFTASMLCVFGLAPSKIVLLISSTNAYNVFNVFIVFHEIL
jgi:hypothetical protein